MPAKTGEGHPDGDPHAGFFRLDDVGLAVKDSEVERQRAEHEQRESDVEPKLVRFHYHVPPRLMHRAQKKKASRYGNTLCLVVVSPMKITRRPRIYDDPVLTIGGIEPVDGFNRLLPTCP